MITTTHCLYKLTNNMESDLYDMTDEDVIILLGIPGHSSDQVIENRLNDLFETADKNNNESQRLYYESIHDRLYNSDYIDDTMSNDGSEEMGFGDEEPYNELDLPINPNQPPPPPPEDSRGNTSFSMNSLLDNGTMDDANLVTSAPNALGYNEMLARSRQRNVAISPTTVQRIVNIDSRFRDNYYGTESCDYSVVLPVRIPDVINMRLVSYQIPASYFCISARMGNNTFVLRNLTTNDDEVTGGFDNDKMTITIPDGNYLGWNTDGKQGVVLQDTINLAIQQYFKQKTIGTMAGGLQDDLNKGIVNEYQGITLDPDDPTTLKGLYYDINDLPFYYSYNRTTGRSAFVANDVQGDETTAGINITSFSLQFNVDSGGNEDLGTPLQSKLGWLLGFRAATYKSGECQDISHGLNYTFGAQEQIIVSEGMCDIRGPKYTFLGIEDYNNSSHEHFIPAFNQSIMKSDILARLNTNTFEKMVEMAASTGGGGHDGSASIVNSTRTYYGPVDIQNLRIRLYDEYGRLLSLNHMDWSFAISLTCIHNGAVMDAGDP